MKIAIINDTHFGARNDSDVFLGFQEKFFSEVFFPYLERHSINHILHLGDLFDRRKYINFKTLYKTEQMFFEPLKASKITMEVIAGNHDVFFKDTNSINCLELIATKYDNVTAYTSQPIMRTYDNVDILLVPWITRDNEQQAMDAINTTPADIVAGHFDIVGFEYMPGVENHEGLGAKTFKRFDQVWSGHYHGKHSKGNIHYFGTQFELTWADAGVAKGFHVFDTETLEVEFIQNPNTLFERIYYDEDSDINYLDADLSGSTGKYIKVVVTKKENDFAFDRFIDRLHHEHPVDISIVKDAQLMEDNYVIEDTQDTLSILDSYIDQMDGDINKSKIKKILRELHTEALAVE